MQVSKFGGGGLTKKMYHLKNVGRFVQLQTLIANISRTRQHIQNRKTLQTRAIPPAFDQKGPVNFGPLTTWNYTKMHFIWETIFRALIGGAAP